MIAGLRAKTAVRFGFLKISLQSFNIPISPIVTDTMVVSHIGTEKSMEKTPEIGHVVFVIDRSDRQHCTWSANLISSIVSSSPMPIRPVSIILRVA
jgi:hypothetical protein